MKTETITQQPELGQVWTPDSIAEAMVQNAFEAYGGKPETVIDPACGPATFEVAMYKTRCIPNQIFAIDCDKKLAARTEAFCLESQLPAIVVKSDYLLMRDLKATADIVIMNPPYIRHENISNSVKNGAFEYLSEELDFIFDRRSNLYCYFLLKAIVDLKAGGVLCAIIYDSLKNTMYGKKVLESLGQHMEITSSKSVLTPFKNVLVDAQILVCKKRVIKMKENARTETAPVKEGFAKLSDLLVIQRGTAIPLREVFMAKPEDLYFAAAKPFLAKQSKMDGLLLDRAPERCYILDDTTHPSLKRWIRNRLKSFGKDTDSIIVRPIKGRILFNYYVRNHPRHLFNPKQIPVSDNFYVSETSNGFPTKAAWLLLNSDDYLKPIIEAGRSQGSGLTKLQLYEYRNSIVPDWRLLPSDKIDSIQKRATALLENEANFDNVQENANKVFTAIQPALMNNAR